jgi:hypothetical protein
MWNIHRIASGFSKAKNLTMSPVAGHPVLEPLYLSFFVNMLPEEFDTITNTIDWDNNTVVELVSNLHQVETRKGLHTATEASAFAVAKKSKSRSLGRHWLRLCRGPHKAPRRAWRACRGSPWDAPAHVITVEVKVILQISVPLRRNKGQRFTTRHKAGLTVRRSGYGTCPRSPRGWSGSAFKCTSRTLTDQAWKKACISGRAGQKGGFGFRFGDGRGRRGIGIEKG